MVVWRLCVIVTGLIITQRVGVKTVSLLYDMMRVKFIFKPSTFASEFWLPFWASILKLEQNIFKAVTIPRLNLCIMNLWCWHLQKVGSGWWWGQAVRRSWNGQGGCDLQITKLMTFFSVCHDLQLMSAWCVERLSQIELKSSRILKYLLF